MEEVINPWTAVPSRIITQSSVLVRRPQKNKSCNDLDQGEMVKQMKDEHPVREESTNDDDSSFLPNGGKWMIFLNRRIRDASGHTELDRAWFQIRDLVKKGILFCAKCSTSNPTEVHGAEGAIMCYTLDYHDAEDVRKAAEAIRKSIEYPHIMYYKTNAATLSGFYRMFGHGKVTIYKYTEECLLYVRNPPSWGTITWRISEVCENTQVFDTVPNGTVNCIADDRVGPHILENTANDIHGIVPSRVKTKPWIHTESKDDFHTGEYGRWLLFLDRCERDCDGFTELDKQWFKIRDLACAGVIKGAKCSTSCWSNPSSSYGIIECYSLIEDIKGTKMAADAIREVVEYPEPIYYISLRELAHYGLFGSYLTIYKHTVDNKFFCRPNKEKMKWKQVDV